MISQSELAHGATIEICGRTVEFARSLENLKRIEGAVGASAPFAARLDARSATHAEIVRAYQALLRGVLDAPPQRDLEAWVFEQGARHSALSLFCYALTLGSDELDAVIQLRNLAAGKAKEGEEDRRPFSPTGGPTGPSSSASATGSGGLRERFGRLPTSK